MKITAGKLAVFFLFLPVGGLAAWIALLAYDVRQDTWTLWTYAIDAVWTIIPQWLLFCNIVVLLTAVTISPRPASRSTAQSR